MGKCIVVEGCDNTGKSTLIDGIRKLITNPKILVIHSGGPPKNVNQLQWSKDYYTQLAYMSAYLPTYSGYDIILDRSWLGETVYAPKYRHYEASYIWAIEYSKINKDNTFLITLVDEAQALMDRDDGLSHEKHIDEYTYTAHKFVDAHDMSCIRHKKLVNISKDGWADPVHIMEWINENSK
jgi:thymidylate kinase